MNILIVCILLYLWLARLLKTFSRTVQIHSIIHCVVAFLWTSYLFNSLGKSIFDTDIGMLLYNLPNEYNLVFEMVICHSIGYFTADTIDILIDSNTNRRVYIFHHVMAVAGLMIVFTGSYMPAYCIWILELGGIAHHLKHAGEVNCNNFGILLADIIYHMVYVSSRIMLGINVWNSFFIINQSSNMISDMVGLVVAFILLVQNTIWWVKNLRKSLYRS